MKIKSLELILGTSDYKLHKLKVKNWNDTKWENKYLSFIKLERNFRDGG